MNTPLLWSLWSIPLIRVCVVTVHTIWYITLVSSNAVPRNIVLGSIILGSCEDLNPPYVGTLIFLPHLLVRAWSSYWWVMVWSPHMLVTVLSSHMVVMISSSLL